MNRRRDVPDDEFPCGRRGRQPRDKGKTFIRQQAHGRFVFRKISEKPPRRPPVGRPYIGLFRRGYILILWGRLLAAASVLSVYALSFVEARCRFITRFAATNSRVEFEECIGSFDTLKIYNRRLRCAGVYPLSTVIVRSHGLRFGSIFMPERKVARKAETRITDVGAWRHATVFRNCPGFSFGAKETGCGTELALFPVAPEENRIAIYLGMFRAYDFVMFFLFIGG